MMVPVAARDALSVVILSTSLKGGAGGGAYKLHQGLRKRGIDSHVLVKFKYDDDDDVIRVPDAPSVRWMCRLTRVGRQDLEGLPLRLYRRREASKLFSAQWVPDTIEDVLDGLSPDVVHLRWVGHLVRIETLPRLRVPVVWTLSDMWAFTGGCYLPEDCVRFRERCGACPHLGSRRAADLSRWVWRRKAKAWADLDLTVVTPSRWLAEAARSSSLFGNKRIEIIPTGVDTNVFKPLPRSDACRTIGVSGDKRIVLFGAFRNHHNKGFHFLTDALVRLRDNGWHDRLELVVFGFDRPADLPDLGIPTRFLGEVTDTRTIAAAYAAADVFVAPSIQENFPNTVLEALACGTPGVAWRTGGLPDLIDHEHNGYIAQPFDVDDLARGIAWTLEDGRRIENLSRAARVRAEREFTLDRYAERYVHLYEDLTRMRKGSGNDG